MSKMLSKKPVLFGIAVSICFAIVFLFSAHLVSSVYAFRFVSWGDTKTGTSSLTQLSNQAKTLSPLFNIYTGDLIESGSGSGTLDTWKAALNGGSNNGTFDITFPVRGNHDSGTSTLWPTYFDLQGVASRIGATNYTELNPDATYSFDYGNSHFVGIDVLGDVTAMSSAQITWLDNDLTAAEGRGLTHAFLFWHGPIYAVDDHCCPNPPSNLITVLNRHPIVSATFHGHEHVIAHTHIDNSRISTVTHPFEEFVTGAAGAGLYSCRSGRSEWCLAANSFATIDVSGNTFTVNAYRQGNTTPVQTWTFNKSDPILIGAGDIVNDTSTGHDHETAQLILDRINSGEDVHVFTTGDNLNSLVITPPSYYDTYFNPSWGQFKSRIRPSAGNHDYNPISTNPDVPSYGIGYFDYFNGIGNNSGPAGDRDKGYYSYNIGSWHIIVLNSNCARSDACGTGTAAEKWQREEDWLTNDLETNKDKVCTAAYWHHPLYSSGQWGNNSFMERFWVKLYNYGVDVVMNGHSHDYERFYPQNYNFVREDTRGIQEFVVGTGGLANTVAPTGLINSAVYQDGVNGVLKLTLHPTSYDWQFIPITGQTFTDSGSRNCVALGSDPEPPTAPTNLTATAASATQVNLSWTASTDNVGVAGYKIFRGGSQIGTSTNTSYSDTGVQAGTPYSYYVTAYDAVGNNSSASNTATVTTPCTAIPTDKGVATTTISLSQAGTYKIWSRIMAPDTTNNSYILQVDNDCGTLVGNASIAANTWTWVDYKDGNSASKLTMSLSAISHAVKLYGSEVGVKLDRLIFTTDLTCVPTGTGDNCLGTQPPPTVDLKVNSLDGPVTIDNNTTANLSWTSANATSCTASGVWSGSKATSGSQSTGSLSGPNSYTYTLTCAGPGGSASDSVTVNVSPPTTKTGALNGDNQVDIFDLSILLSNWGATGGVADINKDNKVDILDLSALISNWGK